MHTNISVNFGCQVDQNISASVIDMVEFKNQILILDFSNVF